MLRAGGNRYYAWLFDEATFTSGAGAPALFAADTSGSRAAHWCRSAVSRAAVSVAAVASVASLHPPSAYEVQQTRA